MYWTGKAMIFIKGDGARSLFALHVAHFVSSNLWITTNVKVKFTLEQATKAQRGSRGIALLFL
jgi:hypothetical protein